MERQYSATLPVHCGKRNDTNHCLMRSWGHDWRGKHILAKSDNESAVHVVKRRSCKDETLMHMLRCLFFIEAHFGFTLVAEHIPGAHNELADAISRNHATLFLSKVPGACRAPTSVPQELYWSYSFTNSPTGPRRTGQPCSLLYFREGLAASTRKTYEAGRKKFIQFCTELNISNPLPVNQQTLCYYVAYTLLNAISLQRR